MFPSRREPDASRLGAPMTAFASAAGELSPAERARIVDQALVLIDQLYVHLPMKRAMYAVDPIQRLKLLRYRLETFGERQFHDELISIFVGLRDMHTTYVLPAPYQLRDAVLPFRLERYFEDDAPRYIVTALAFGFTHELFRPGVAVTHWNGTPIERAVEQNADRNGGSN